MLNSSPATQNVVVVWVNLVSIGGFRWEVFIILAICLYLDLFTQYFREPWGIYV